MSKVTELAIDSLVGNGFSVGWINRNVTVSFPGVGVVFKGKSRELFLFAVGVEVGVFAAKRKGPRA